MLGMLHPYQLLRRHQMVLLFSFFLILDYFVWVGSENFLQFPGFDLMVGFPSGQFGTDGWKSNKPLVEFPSTGWISISWLKLVRFATAWMEIQQLQCIGLSWPRCSDKESTSPFLSHSNRFGFGFGKQRNCWLPL